MRPKIVFLFSLFFVVISTDSTAAIWNIGKKKKQNTTLSYYVANAHFFSWEYPQEKVYLQFDNTSYVQGETIWFKAYVVNAINFRRAQSKVLYVELLNAKGKIIKKLKLKVVAGQADGYFELTENGSSIGLDRRGDRALPEGFYEIRAYTANMLNFDSESVFSRVLPVMSQSENTEFGTLHNDPKLNMPETPSILRKDSRPAGGKFDEMNVSFYPEGGRMIMGRPSRVAFKVTDRYGMGMEAEGLISDSIKIKVDHDGMGSFEFTPTRENYRIRFFHSNGYSKSFSLPRVDKSGCTVLVGDHDDGILPVRIVMSDDFSRSNDSLGVAVLCRGEIYYYEPLMIDNTITDYSMSIPTETLPDGVCQLCVFDIKGKPATTRMFYSDTKHEYPSIKISTDKDSYDPFDQMVVGVDISYKEKPFRDRVCLAVRDGSSPKSKYAEDLRVSMLLTSDLAGLVWNPEYYFESDDQEHKTALDLLCMVQGWERYDWEVMTGIREYREKHRLEDSIMLNGWVMSPFLSRMLDGISVYANVILPDSTIERFATVTSDHGYFGLNLSDFDGVADMYLWTDGTAWNRLRGTDCALLLERSMYPATRRFMPGEIMLDTATLSKEPRTLLERIFSKTQTVEMADTISELAKILKQSDGSYLIPDIQIHEKRLFVDYATFEDFNVRQDVENRMDGANFSTDILGYLMEGRNMSIEDLYSIVFMVHCDELAPLKMLPMNPLSLDSYNVESLLVYDDVLPDSIIDTIAFLYQNMNPGMFTICQYVAGGGYAGKFHKLIEMKLRPARELLTQYELMDISWRLIDVQGYSNSHKKFYSPQYPDGGVVGEIDHRRTLYWNPNLITDDEGHAEVKFYNNSYSKTFSISATGMTATGLPYCVDVGL